MVMLNQMFEVSFFCKQNIFQTFSNFGLTPALRLQRDAASLNIQYYLWIRQTPLGPLTLDALIFIRHSLIFLS